MENKGMINEETDKILDVIHKTIYQFFDVCADDEEVPIYDRDKLLLDVNKAICDNLKALEQEQKTGCWIDTDPDDACFYMCSNCHGRADIKFDYCPNCGAKMEKQYEI